jgi:hypothetical protein
MPVKYSCYACCVSLDNQINFRLISNFHRAVVDAPVQRVIALNLLPYSLTGENLVSSSDRRGRSVDRGVMRAGAQLGCR